MKCTKKISITGYRIQYVDLREPKPRTPKEEIYTVDKDWIDAMGLLRLNIPDAIKAKYEKAGFRAFSVVQIKPKRCVTITLDLNEQWELAEQEATSEEYMGETDRDPADEMQEG